MGRLVLFFCQVVVVLSVQIVCNFVMASHGRNDGEINACRGIVSSSAASIGLFDFVVPVLLVSLAPGQVESSPVRLSVLDRCGPDIYIYIKQPRLQEVDGWDILLDKAPPPIKRKRTAKAKPVCRVPGGVRGAVWIKANQARIRTACFLFVFFPAHARL
jgi:hypothetical protein